MPGADVDAPPASWLSATIIGAVAKFQASAWGQKLAKQAAKAQQNDFDRFKTTLAKVRQYIVAIRASGGRRIVQRVGCHGSSREGDGRILEGRTLVEDC